MKVKYLLAVLCVANQCFAQCPFTVDLTNVGVCPGAKLTAGTANTPANIVWYDNGSPVSTVNATTSFNPNGVTVAGIGGGGNGANQLSFPQGIFVDAAGNIYVSDEDNWRIQKYAPGSSSGVTVAGGNGFGSALDQLNGAAGIYVDAAGNMYIADYGNFRVLKWAPGATAGVVVAGGNGSGSAANQFDFPVGLYVDAAGNIYVADDNNQRVQRWAPGATTGVTVAGGNGSGSAANQFMYPIDVFVDAAGNVYVVDDFNNRVQKWAPGATAGVTVAGGNGNGSAANQLSYPYGVCVDANGDVFVGDAGNNRVQEWMPGATSGVTVAGGNGPGIDANQMTDPRFVRLDANGNLYVSEDEDNRVQEFTPQSTIDNTYIAPSPGTYTAVVTNTAGCSSTSNPIVIQGTTTPTISITTPVNPVYSCTMATFTATTTGAGSASVYQWQINGINAGTGTPTFSTGGLNNGDAVSCTITANNSCSSNTPVTSNTIPMTVGGLPVATMLSKDNYCPGDRLLITSPDSLSQIIWLDNGAAVYTAQASPPGTGKPVPAKDLLDTLYMTSAAGSYTAEVTTSGGCFVNAGPIVVNPTVNAAVTIAAGATESCSGSQVSFTATPVNGGTTPAYQWQVNGANAGANTAVFNSSTLTGTNLISCIMTSSASCSQPATSNTVPLKVDPMVTPAISINPSATNICSGATVDFTAMPTNGGTDPMYQWTVNGGTVGDNTAAFSSSDLKNGDVIGCTLTGDAVCATTATAPANTITMHVSSTIPPIVTVSPSADPICSGTQVIFSAATAPVEQNEHYTWQVNGTDLGTDSPAYSTAALQNGDIITCQATTSDVCAAALSNSITMAVNPTPVIAPGQVFADAGNGVQLAPQISGNIGSYSWSPATGLSVTDIANPFADPPGTTVYTLDVLSTDGCAAEGKLTVKVYTPIRIPNAFTPNGDGHNDIFYVLGGPEGSMIKDFSVFDRWGQRVFGVHNVGPGDPTFGWNGTYKGQSSPIGAYVYVVSISLADGERQQFQGTVMLIR